MWAEIRTSRDQSVTNYCHGQARLDLGKKYSYQSRVLRNKTNLKNTFPQLSLLGQNFTLDFLFLPYPQVCKGTGNGGHGQFITCCLCFSFLLRGIRMASSPSSFTDLGACRVFSLMYSPSSLQLQLLLHRAFLPPF